MFGMTAEESNLASALSEESQTSHEDSQILLFRRLDLVMIHHAGVAFVIAHQDPVPVTAASD
jgi:hypothetical protein